jgi:hypothetical protein
MTEQAKTRFDAAHPLVITLQPLGAWLAEQTQHTKKPRVAVLGDLVSVGIGGDGKELFLLYLNKAVEGDAEAFTKLEQSCRTGFLDDSRIVLRDAKAAGTIIYTLALYMATSQFSVLQATLPAQALVDPVFQTAMDALCRCYAFGTGVAPSKETTVFLGGYVCHRC